MGTGYGVVPIIVLGESPFLLCTIFSVSGIYEHVIVIFYRQPTITNFGIDGENIFRCLFCQCKLASGFRQDCLSVPCSTHLQELACADIAEIVCSTGQFVSYVLDFKFDNNGVVVGNFRAVGPCEVGVVQVAFCGELGACILVVDIENLVDNFAGLEGFVVGAVKMARYHD